jgi:hypothetical protein
MVVIALISAGCGLVRTAGGVPVAVVQFIFGAKSTDADVWPDDVWRSSRRGWWRWPRAPA